MSIKYKDYLKFKDNNNKSYSSKFKNVRISATIFSIFGNIASIFFAYFFVINLFNTSFMVNSDKNYFIIGGVVIFLSLFEYIKRYIFDIYSTQQVTNSKNIFGKGKFTFLFITAILICVSFFLSLNGAQKLINKESKLVDEVEIKLKDELDSINNFYSESYIKYLNNENIRLLDQKDKITEQQSNYVNRGWNTNRFISQINDITKQLNDNKTKISFYESERDLKIQELKESEISKLDKRKEENSYNITYFLILSSIIEIIILSGVYYNRYYEHRIMKEYEENTVNTANFRKWKLSNDILNLIFKYGDIDVDSPIPSTNSIMEIIDLNNLKIKKTDLMNSFKLFSYLKIYESRGSRRFLKMTEEDANKTLSDYYKIY